MRTPIDDALRIAHRYATGGVPNLEKQSPKNLARLRRGERLHYDGDSGSGDSGDGDSGDGSGDSGDGSGDGTGDSGAAAAAAGTAGQSGDDSASAAADAADDAAADAADSTDDETDSAYEGAPNFGMNDPDTLAYGQNFGLAENQNNNPAEMGVTDTVAVPGISVATANPDNLSEPADPNDTDPSVVGMFAASMQDVNEPTTLSEVSLANTAFAEPTPAMPGIAVGQTNPNNTDEPANPNTDIGLQSMFDDNLGLASVATNPANTGVNTSIGVANPADVDTNFAVAPPSVNSVVDSVFGSGTGSSSGTAGGAAGAAGAASAQWRGGAAIDRALRLAHRHARSRGR